MMPAVTVLTVVEIGVSIEKSSKLSAGSAREGIIANSVEKGVGVNCGIK
jgi:hypothetical protein